MPTRRSIFYNLLQFGEVSVRSVIFFAPWLTFKCG